MPRTSAGANRLRIARPIGVSAGGGSLLLAWLGGAAMARLTGATAIVIVLTAGLVWMVAAVLAGFAALCEVDVGEAMMPTFSTQGEPFPISVAIRNRSAAPLWVEVRSGGVVICSGWSGSDEFRGEAAMQRRGPVRNLHVHVRTAGTIGLVWWNRPFEVVVEEHLVAPRATAGAITIDRTTGAAGAELSGRPGAVSGEIDGVRPWREGDSEKFVHWASSLRSGQLIVHDRRRQADQRWIVRATPGVPDPDVEAGRARAAIERGLRSGALVSAASGDGQPVSIPDPAAAARWTALVDLGEIRKPSGWRRRRLSQVEPETTGRRSGRWWMAATTIVSLVMLTDALGYGTFVTAIVVATALLGAAVSAPALATGAPVSRTVRGLVGVGAFGAFLLVAAHVAQLSGLLAILRGPLAQVLVILILLHGFECRDRRTTRVGLGISAVVLMYALGFRVDGTILWWLVAWGLCFGIAAWKLGLPTKPAGPWTPPRRSAVRRNTARVAAITLGVAATVAVLATVPIPDGPARLTLPTLIEDAGSSGVRGEIVGPDGEPNDGNGGDGSRAPAGVAGGYVGFAEAMDTSVRGPLSDAVVMRVRAPAADFWRGQTFSTFDGRQWHADQESGVARTGPSIGVPPAMGDFGSDSAIDSERFVQTFYVEADMPNVVFAAYRPDQLIIDADVWTRDDGAIRASTVFTEGDVYTVVSERQRITSEELRRQGLVQDRLSDFGRVVLERYLTVPESTSGRTTALADQLAVGQATTYDVVRAYERWLGEHVVYDLDAPVPDDGEDAVDDFLFESRRGFCEQIASALAVMLRTQGVPTRIATGYAAGTRDSVAGVFEVRGSDAHAWVEVWFPEVGWQAFDPTASVPLAGESSPGSLGSELADGASGFIAAHRQQIAIVALAVALGVGAVMLAGEISRRRRRGRWGLLQDRFAAIATRRGAPEGATNPRRAGAWTADDDAAVAAEVARTLDRAAFDPTFVGDRAAYLEARKRVGSLAGGRR